MVMPITGGSAGQRAGSAQAGRFDAFRLATRAESLAGEIDVGRRPRVCDRLAQTAGPAMISWRIDGGRDALDRPTLTLTVQGSLPLVCQRCLLPFDAPIELRSELLLAHDETELARLDMEEAEVLLASAPLDATTLVEDELLLSLPFAPMHPDDRCPAMPARAHESDEVRRGRDRVSPFARLAALKKEPDGTFEE
jgi:DUF177 domain-containing protein